MAIINVKFGFFGNFQSTVGPFGKNLGKYLTGEREFYIIEYILYDTQERNL